MVEEKKRPKMIYMTGLEAYKIRKENKKKGGRTMRGILFMKKCKKAKKSRSELRNTGQGYASLNWERVELGRK